MTAAPAGADAASAARRLLAGRAVEAVLERRGRVAAVRDAASLDAWAEIKVRWQPPFDAAAHDAWLPAPLVYYTDVPMPALRSLPRDGPRRVFDLVLYNQEDWALQARLRELAAVADQTILLQTAFTFNGAAKATPAPEVDSRVAARVQRVVLERPPPVCWARRYARPRAFKGASANATMIPWCVQSAVRNTLGLAFVRAGGRPTDWAVISDGDEVPMAAALARLRDTPADKRGGAAVYALGLIRNFRYTFRCEAGTAPAGPWTAGGAVAVPGHVLLAMGAQRARDHGARSCVKAGFRASTGKVRREFVTNASWHFSSFGDPESLMHKMRSNSYAYPEELFSAKLLRRRQRDCLPNIATSALSQMSAMSPSVYTFSRTPWSPTNLPRYPDVPKHLEEELARGDMLYLVDADAKARAGGDRASASAGGGAARESRQPTKRRSHKRAQQADARVT